MVNLGRSTERRRRDDASAIRFDESFVAANYPQMVRNGKHENDDDDERVVYLNAAGQTPLPDSARRVGVATLTRRCEPWTEKEDDEEVSEEVRRGFAILLRDGLPRATGNDVAVFPSTSHALSVAAANVGRALSKIRSEEEKEKKIRRDRGGEKQKRGRHRRTQIVLLGRQFPSNVWPWKWLCREHPDLEIVEVEPESEDDDDWTTAVCSKVTRDTLVVSVPAYHWCHGARVDLERVARAAARASSSNDERAVPGVDRPFFFVDATQSIGVVPLPSFDDDDDDGSRRCPPDLVACTTHKWLNGPYGLCLCYVDPRVANEWYPLDQHHRNRVVVPAGDDAVDLDYDASFSVTGARRLDAGGKPNPTLLPAMRESLRLLLESWTLGGDLRRVERELRRRTTRLVRALAPLERAGSVRVRSGAPHVVGVRPSATDAAAVVERLRTQHRVHAAAKEGWVRVSPYLYNADDDVDRFAECLEECLRTLTSTTTTTTSE